MPTLQSFLIQILIYSGIFSIAYIFLHYLQSASKSLVVTVNRLCGFFFETKYVLVVLSLNLDNISMFVVCLL